MNINDDQWDNITELLLENYSEEQVVSIQNILMANSKT